MLVCEACDKGYHTFCMEPAIEGVPADSWKCKVRPAALSLLCGGAQSCLRPHLDVPRVPQNCRLCSDCGRRPAELDPGCQWHQSFSVCEGCQQRRAAKEAEGVQDRAPQLEPPAQA